MTRKTPKKPQERFKTSKEIRQRFFFKTILDGLVSGLIAIGTFLGRPPNPKPAQSYYWILGLFAVIISLLALYNIVYRKKKLNVLALVVIILVVIGETFFIGFAFYEPIESIFITILLTLPSVIIFDELLG